MLAQRLVLLNFVTRVGNVVVLPPVDGEGDPEGTCCVLETAGPFDLSFMLCHVLSLMQLHVLRPSGLRQLHLDLLRSALSLSAWVIIGALRWGIDLRSLSFCFVSYSSETSYYIIYLKVLL